jgi:putative hydrolase of HD superfamily
MDPAPRPLLPVLPSLLALQPLESLTRTGWAMHGIANPETIAGHVLGVCHAILALGPRVVPALDVERCLALALVHDAPEALLGDLPRTAGDLLPPGAKAQAEEKAARSVLSGLSPIAVERFGEYRAQRTREARFTRLCDRLQMGVRLVGYRRLGVHGLEGFAAAIEALDCAEFAPAETLRAEILAAL